MRLLYCQSTLRGTEAVSSKQPERGGMGIEHWAARHEAPERVFDWSNLLGVCPGVIIRSEEQEKHDNTAAHHRYHCDTYRGLLPPARQALALNPKETPPDASRCFDYTFQGELKPARHLTPQMSRRLREDIGQPLDIEGSDPGRLNLNHPRLMRNRREVLDHVRAQLQKLQRRNKYTRGKLLALCEEYRQRNAQGVWREYCQIAINYLERKLRR